MKHTMTLLGVAVLSACAALPEPGALPDIEPPTTFASTQVFSTAAGNWPAANWWQAYGDAQLDALIAEALRQSPSMAVAEARLRRARAYQDDAQGALAPRITGSTSITG